MTAPQRTVLALNVGSSSVKFAVFAQSGQNVLPLREGSLRQEGDHHWIEAKQGDDDDLSSRFSRPRDGSRLETLLDWINAQQLPAPIAIGHRVVHGGVALREHIRIDADVLQQLENACVFAPLHVPPALTLIREAMATRPHLPHVACLDTTFHRTLPALARVLPLPANIRDEGVERFGFHGLSCESIVRQLDQQLPARLVIAHLGSGASVSAVADGRSIDTSMGLTPTGGVVMATRPGDLDPGVLLYLLRAHRYNAQTLEELLDRHAGLLGISGLSGDVRQLQDVAEQHPDARLALQQFVQSVAKQIAAMTIALGGLDLLVFTGGIGEHNAAIREAICAKLKPVLPQLLARTLPTQENACIARHTLRLADE
ncbi:MAG: acetate kinase [Dyella sp.]